MKIQINIEKKHFFVLLGVIVLLAGSIFVYAQTPPNPGHGASQVGAGAFSGNEYVIPNGNLGVGVSAPISNSEGWGRVIDLFASVASRLSVRAGPIDGRILAHTLGWFGAPAGMIIGTGSAHPLSFATSGVSRMTIDSAGAISATGNIVATGAISAANVQAGGQDVCREDGTNCKVMNQNNCRNVALQSSGFETTCYANEYIAAITIGGTFPRIKCCRYI